MNCVECGEALSADDAFCRACGNKVAQTSNADRDTALDAADKNTAGHLGYWGLGMALCAPLLGYGLSLLPAGLEATLGAVAIIAMAVAGLLGLLLSVVALAFQRGAGDKAAGALTLAGFAIFYFFIDRQDD